MAIRRMEEVVFESARGKRLVARVVKMSDLSPELQAMVKEDGSRILGLFQLPETEYLVNGSAIDRLYDLYLRTFDYAVPQDWFEEYMNQTGKRPQAVWSYDTNSYVGEPVFFDDLVKRFTSDLMKRLYVEA